MPTLTKEEYIELVKSSIKEATKDLTEENELFIEDMKKQLAEALKPTPDTKAPGTEKIDPKGGFVNFADYASAVHKDEVFRGQPAKQDKRLMAWQEKTAGEGLEEGTDSEGGYGLNAHLKLDHMLETPKVLMTTKVTL